eukprot:scaffold11905_cov21-Tisochrysis_lutea.AAC.2
MAFSSDDPAVPSLHSITGLVNTSVATTPGTIKGRKGWRKAPTPCLLHLCNELLLAGSFDLRQKQGELTEYMHEHTRKSQLEAFGLRRQRICLCGSLVNSRLRTEISEHVLVDYVGEP